MKRDVINRYERNINGDIQVDVAAKKVEDLYNHFDRNAPYLQRDLDQDLVNYLTDCARELNKEPFSICFTLSNLPDETELLHIKQSINSFFLSLVEAEKEKLWQRVRGSLVFFCIGIAILFISVWVNQQLGPDRTVVADVFAEGLTVAAWVSLWEALATLLIKWFPYRTNINLYRRLAAVPFVFRSSSETM